MIIKRVHFKNFRILRDVVIDFSDSEEKNLTVVRAENESGKTTVLLGLQWAFFSSKSLPKESDFRLYPINWDFDRFPSVKIEIEIDFEHSTFRPTANGGTRDVKRDYRLIRIAEETQEAQSYEEAALYEIKPQGTIPIEPFELKLQEMLPLDLREVFFTDGDRALSFIEADISRNDKRERVRGAVRSLLGLNIVENAESHVEEVFRSLNKQVKKQTDDIESNQISSELSNIDERLDTLIQEKKKLSDDLINIDLNINKVRRRLDSALIKGDKEELQKQLNSTEKSINQIQNEISKVEHLHTSLFKDEAVFYFLLKPLINSGITELQKQKDAGTIPKNTVPVLEERLECSECLCGESLDNNTVDGKRRRAIILRKIEEQKHRDRLRDTLTTIYYQTKGLTQKSDSASGVWLNTYKSIQERQDFLDYNLEKSESDYKDIDKKIDEIGDVDVNMLRTQEKRYRSIKTQISIDSQSVSREIKVMENRKIELSKQLESTLKKREKTQTLLSEMTVVRDVQDVFRETHSIIMNQELMKVSDTMNEYFIEMILADPDQKSIIRKTESEKSCFFSEVIMDYCYELLYC